MSSPSSPHGEPSDKSNLWSYAYSGTQLAVSVLAGLGIGIWADRKWGLSPWMTLTGAAVGLAAGLYSFLKPFLSPDDPK